MICNLENILKFSSCGTSTFSIFFSFFQNIYTIMYRNQNILSLTYLLQLQLVKPHRKYFLINKNKNFKKSLSQRLIAQFINEIKDYMKGLYICGVYSLEPCDKETLVIIKIFLKVHNRLVCLYKDLFYENYTHKDFNNKMGRKVSSRKVLT